MSYIDGMNRDDREDDIKTVAKKRGQVEIMLELDRMIDRRLTELREASFQVGVGIVDFDINDFYKIQRDLVNKFDLHP